jgi:hypothetical protein
MENLKAKQVEVVTNSKDYDLFDYLIGYNREVSESHIEKLKESFSMFGIASLFITIVKTKAFKNTIQLIIGDGQHSLRALKELAATFNYVVVELEDDTPLNVTKYISALNNNVMSWGTGTYLDSYAINGISEYKTLKEAKDEHKLTITDLLTIFDIKNKDFKEGTIEFPNEADSLKLLKAVVMVKPYIPNKAYTRRSLYKVMKSCDNYNALARGIIEAAGYMAKAKTKFSENEKEFHQHLMDIKDDVFKVELKKAA